jgi:hypothetical protein
MIILPDCVYSSVSDVRATIPSLFAFDVKSHFARIHFEA